MTLDYPSKSLLIHPDESPAGQHAILDAAREGRHTLCWSAGDAAKLGGTVVLMNWPPEDKEAYEEFFRLYSPSITVLSASTSPRSVLRMDDPQWCDYRYGLGRCSTIGARGCWICDCAMAQRYYHIDDVATPIRVDQTVGDQGYNADCAMLWSAMTKLGLVVKGSTNDAARATRHLLADGLLFIEVLPLRLQHFVMGVAYDEVRDDFFVLDPLTGQAAYLQDLYDGYETFRLINKLIEENEPTKPIEGNEPTKLLAMHAQHNLEGLPEMAARVGAVKIVEDAGTMTAMTPDTYVVFRNHLGGDAVHKYAYRPYLHFDECIAPFLDYYGDAMDVIEDGMNERIGPSDRDENKAMIEHALITRELVAGRTSGEIKCAMLNPGPGAFPLKWIEDFDPVFEASHRYGDPIGLHPYIPAIKDQVWLDKWYPFRMMQIYEYADAKGWPGVTFLGTEYGFVGGYVDEGGVPHLNPGAGWRHGSCLGGDWAEHQRLSAEAASTFIKWNEENGWPLRFLFYFTIMNWDWENFRYYTEQFNDIADLAEELYARTAS